jgi:hypothetical protein
MGLVPPAGEVIYMSEGYMVAYAKMSIDKDAGISLQGVYLGGVSDSHEEAELIARDCVNSIKGKTILPRIMRIDAEYKIIDALYDAHDRFEQMTEKMREAESIMCRESKKR